ncbi:TetR family transcriptional regulator [Rhodococcus sp. ACS1]|nr:TetR family transcriptional regulator [Rhodococcus sp. ACS1]
MTLFSERTFPVIGMRDISEAVGLRPGSLYAHINSKEELLEKVVHDGITNYLDELRPIAESNDPAPERMRAAIRAHVKVLAKTLAQTRVAFHQWQFLGGDAQKEIVGLRKQYENIFRRIYRDGVQEGSFREARSERIAALAVIGMLTSASEWYDPEGALGADEFGDALAEAAVDGLLP